VRPALTAKVLLGRGCLYLASDVTYVTNLLKLLSGGPFLHPRFGGFPLKSIFLTLVAFAGLGVASAITPAGIVTSLTQCESQNCTSLLPHTLSYNGPFSGFPGTQTVGQGAFVSANGVGLPSLTDQLPTSSANVLNTAQMYYFLEVVPLNGNTNVTPVQLGVIGSGTTSVETSSNGTPDPGNLPSGLNDAANFLGLSLLSESSGSAVFSDTVILQYVNGYIYSNGVIVGCDSSNTSTTSGAGFITGVTTGCSGSSASGGINENGTYSISTNSIYRVVMTANITVGTGNDGNANGSGVIQAAEFVDPSFTVPNGYQLVLSDGFGNGDVPEPGTWATLAAGLGLLIIGRAGRACVRGR
jgi:hypothetical protein